MAIDKFDLEKLNPWNWFKHENSASQNQAEQLPVTRQEAQWQTSNYNDPFQRLHNELDQLFDRVLGQFGLGSSLRRFNPGVPSLLGSDNLTRLDIAADDKQYHIAVDVPGFNQENLSIDVQNDILRISGQRESENKQDDKHYYRVERSTGTFQRTLSLPQDADANEIRASLKDGVLTLDIPKKAVAQQESKRIKIGSALVVPCMRGNTLMRGIVPIKDFISYHAVRHLNDRARSFTLRLI